MSSRTQYVLLGTGLLVAGALLFWATGGRAPGADGRADFRGHERFRDRLSDPLFDTRAALSGDVSDADGAAIEGARVCATAQSADLPSELSRVPRCATTSAGGRFAIGELLAGFWRLDASARGRRPVRWRDAGGRTSIRLDAGETKDDVEIVLAAGGVEITGVVKDATGGFVGGATVVASGGWWDAGARAEATCDDRGEFRVTVAEGTVSVRAEAHGYAPGVATGSAPGAPIEVLLTPESVIAGVVVRAEDGKPVPGARVSAGDVEGRRSLAVAFSDAEGRFRLARLEPGRYKPEAEAPGLYGQAAESVLLGVAETREDVVLPVHEARIVAGRIVTETEEPCREGSVRIAAAGRPGMSAAVEKDGGVAFRAVLPGTWKVSVTCTGFLAEETYPELVVGEADVDGLSWTVRKGLAIRGTVEDERGEPIAEADVDARVGRGFESRQRGQGRSDAGGKFTIEGIAPGEYVVSASAAGFASRSADSPTVPLADRDAGDVRLRLSRGGRLEGEVVDSNGSPVSGAEVGAAAEEESGWVAPVASGADGRFAFPALAAGAYTLGARRATGSRFLQESEMTTAATVLAGATVQVRLVVPGAQDEIRGQVVDASGSPIADAFVDSERERDDRKARDQLRWRWRRTPALTDHDGRFVLSNLEAGVHTVFAYRKGGGEAIAEHVKSGESVLLTLRETGTLSGRVEIEGGSPPERFAISIADAESGSRRTESWFRTGGQWRFSDVPPGTYRVGVEATEGTASVDGIELADGGERDGIRLVLTARGRVRGQVVDLTTNEPLPSVVVAVQAGSSAGAQMALRMDGRPVTTDAGGRFVIESAPSGPGTLIAFPPKTAWLPAKVPLEIPPGGELELPPIRLVKSAGGKPGELDGALGLGIEVLPAEGKPADRRVTVKTVAPGGPAESAGVVPGDVVLKVDGQDVTGAQTYLFYGLTRVAAGTTVELELSRGPVTLTAAPRG